MKIAKVFFYLLKYKKTLIYKHKKFITSASCFHTHFLYRYYKYLNSCKDIVVLEDILLICLRP